MRPRSFFTAAVIYVDSQLVSGPQYHEGFPAGRQDFPHVGTSYL